MATGDSPAVARRRLRLALRTAREAAGHTQTQVAEEMEWSLSKIMRIESGEVTIAPNDLRPLVAYLGITDRAEIDQMIQDSKVSRRRQMWWDDPRFREELTTAMRQTAQYEAEATSIRYYATMLVPGVLQIPDYARAVLGRFHEELPSNRLATRFESRLKRRDALLARAVPPMIYLLADESVILRSVGGPDVMNRQLADLTTRIDSGRLYVRILPFSLDAPLPSFGSFDIYGLSEDDENAILYRESFLDDDVVEDPVQVNRHRAMFERLWAESMDEPTSYDLILGAAKSDLEGSALAAVIEPHVRPVEAGRRQGRAQ